MGYFLSSFCCPGRLLHTKTVQRVHGFLWVKLSAYPSYPGTVIHVLASVPACGECGFESRSSGVSVMDTGGQCATRPYIRIGRTFMLYDHDERCPLRLRQAHPVVQIHHLHLFLWAPVKGVCIGSYKADTKRYCSDGYLLSLMPGMTPL